jgi:hypothetical protein
MANVDGKHCPASSTPVRLPSDCCPASVGLLSAINRIHCPQCIGFRIIARISPDHVRSRPGSQSSGDRSERWNK